MPYASNATETNLAMHLKDLFKEFRGIGGSSHIKGTYYTTRCECDDKPFRKCAGSDITGGRVHLDVCVG